MSELWDGDDYREAQLDPEITGPVGRWRRRTPRRNRMLDNNRTFTKLATDFDQRLQDYRDSEQAVKDAVTRRDTAAREMRMARDQLLSAYPELAPEKPSQATPVDGGWTPPGPGAFTPIEVDDADDVPDFSERR